MTLLSRLSSMGLNALKHVYAQLNGYERKQKSALSSYTPGFGTSGIGTIDSYRQKRAPGSEDLLYELKNTAAVCAAGNAATCAAYHPMLYVRTMPGQDQPVKNFPVANISPERKAVLMDNPEFAKYVRKGDEVQLVQWHP